MDDDEDVVITRIENTNLPKCGHPNFQLLHTTVHKNIRHHQTGGIKYHSRPL